jgi:transcriptional regulator with XRE-family HTH domain
LKALRQRHGLTQEGFAEIAGMSYKYFQAVEAGRRPDLRLSTLERLASGFSLEVWELLAPEEPPLKVLKQRKGGTPHKSARNL